MSQKISQLSSFAGGIEGSEALSGGVITPSTGVVLATDRALTPRKMVLNVTALVVSVTAALDYGGTKLCDLPDSNIMILGVECDLELTKDGTGIAAATDINMGIGSAAASATTLATTMQNMLDVEAFTATDASPAYKRHGADNSTTVHPTQLADGATNALWLNCAATLSADGTLTCDGTVTIYYLDLGNVTS